MQNILRLPALAAVLLCSTALSSHAQESPDAAELSNMVEAELPPFWSIENFKIVATSDTGDAVAPRRAFRFEADGKTKSPLYAETSQEGPFALVVPTVEVGASRTLYGVLDLGYKAGNWAGSVMIENPVTALGKPRDLFDIPSLVIGSEETDTKLAALRSTSIASALNQAEQEINRIKGETRSQIAQLEQEQKEQVSKIQTAHRTRLSALKQSQLEELSKTKSEYRTQLAKLTSENEPLLEEAQAERAKLIAEENKKTRSALEKLEAEAAAELEDIKVEHATKRGQLIEKQRQEYAALETRLATEAASLRKQLDTSEELIALQQELRASLEKRNLGSKELFAAFKDGILERTEFLSQVPKMWMGTHTCSAPEDKTTGKPGFNISYPLYLRIEKVRSNGAAIRMGDDSALHSGTIANLTWLDDVSAFPLKFNLVSERGVDIGNSEVQYSMEITLSQSGKLTGSDTQRFGFRGSVRPATCTIELSS